MDRSELSEAIIQEMETVVRRVVVLCDGAAWIGERARAFLGVGGVEISEIVDIDHAYYYLRIWDVGNAVFGTGSAAASTWAASLKARLYEQGAAPVLAALAALGPATVEAAEAHHAAVSYFTTHAARMDYPRLVAQHLPIGTGAVESSCTCLVETRAKLVEARAKQPNTRACTGAPPACSTSPACAPCTARGAGTPAGAASRSASTGGSGCPSGRHQMRQPWPRLPGQRPHHRPHARRSSPPASSQTHRPAASTALTPISIR